MNPMYFDPYVRMPQKRHWLAEDKRMSQRPDRQRQVNSYSSQSHSRHVRPKQRRFCNETLDTFLFRWSDMHTYVFVRVLDDTIAILPVRSRLAFLYFHHAPFPRQPSALLLTDQQKRKQSKSIKKGYGSDKEKSTGKKQQQQQPSIVISPTSPTFSTSPSSPSKLNKTATTQTTLGTTYPAQQQSQGHLSQHYPGKKIHEMIKKWRHSLIEDSDDDREAEEADVFKESQLTGEQNTLKGTVEKSQHVDLADHENHRNHDKRKKANKTKIHNDSGIQTDGSAGDTTSTTDNEDATTTIITTDHIRERTNNDIPAAIDDMTISLSGAFYPSSSVSRSSSYTIGQHSEGETNDKHRSQSHHQALHHHQQQRKVTLSDVLGHERKTTLEKGWIHAPCTVFSEDSSVIDDADVMITVQTKHRRLILKARSTKEKRMFLNLVKLKQQQYASQLFQQQPSKQRRECVKDVESLSLSDDDSTDTDTTSLPSAATMALNDLSNNARIPIADLTKHLRAHIRIMSTSIDTHLAQITASKQQVKYFSRQLLELDVSLDSVMDSTLNVHFSPMKRVLDYVNHQLAESITRYQQNRQRMMELQERVSIHDRFLTGARQRYEQILQKMLKKKLSMTIGIWIIVSAALVGLLAVLIARLR